MHRLSAYAIVHRTQSNQTPNAIRSDTERNPIRRRTETDRMADGNRLDGERKRYGVQLSQLHQPSQLAIYCSCLSCNNKAYRAIISRTAA